MGLNLAYQQKETIIHRLDPRVKLLWMLSISLLLTTWNDPLFLLGLLTVLLLYARMAQIPFRQSARTVLPGLPFVVMILIVNVILWRPPSPEKAHLIGHLFASLPFYWETVFFSLGTTLRIFVLMINMVTLIRTISPTELALAMTRLGLPAEIGMTVSMAISYIPAVINQLQTMMETQQSRALKMNTNNPVARFLAYLPVTIPTFFRSFQTAETMAAAMMSRGFGYDMTRRTELKPVRFSPQDWLWTVVISILLVCGMIIGIRGIAYYTLTMQLVGLN